MATQQAPVAAQPAPGHAGHHEHGGGGHDAHGGGHEAHGGGHGGHGDHVAMFRSRFWLSLLLTIPVVGFSRMFGDLLGYMPPTFPGSALISPVLGTVVFLYGGWPFLTGGWSELRQRRPGMMLLITMAIAVAFIASALTELDLLDLDFWWELALLVTIMLLGHWQEMKAIGDAQDALEALADLLPDEAEVIDPDGGGAVRTVPLSSLAVGDVVLVRSGGRIPADGVVVDGEAEVDESTVTGESKPVPKGLGDRVVAGTVSTDSALRVRVAAVGEDTALAGIRRLVEEAQTSRSRAQALADRAAALLFYVALATGIATFTLWSLLGDVDEAITRTVTVLVIACPHALGLAIPLVISLSTAIASRAGILVKDRLALERMRTIDAVLFDKTGTLTRGAPALTGVAVVPGSPLARDEDELLAIAGAVEADSEHPLARAVVAAAVARVPADGRRVAGGFRSITGRGVEAEVDGTTVAVGGPALLRERSLAEPPQLAGAVEAWKQRGATVLHVVAGDQVVGALALEDEIRPESADAVRQLHDLGVKVVMITGDARQVAEAVGRQVGVDEVVAEVLPEDKDQAVAALQRGGQRVAMVGDGVNDAPALARADVGIAIGAGTDVAIAAAGVVLASSDPRSVVGVIRLSRSSYRKMVQNLVWATGYNVVALPLAAGVLAWAGIVFSPAVGAILMSASTIVVAANAQLLRRLDLRPGPAGGAAGGPAAPSDGEARSYADAGAGA